MKKDKTAERTVLPLASLAVLVVFLLVLFYFLGHSKPQSQVIFQSLPKGALTPGFAASTEVKLVSASPMSVNVSPGQNASFNIVYSIHSGKNPGEVVQAFFAYSWSPSWPPSAGYYQQIYEGIPGLAPGITNTTTLIVPVPKSPGTYYAWFLMGSYYNFSGAISAYTTEPPNSSAPIKIVVR